MTFDIWMVGNGFMRMVQRYDHVDKRVLEFIRKNKMVANGSMNLYFPPVKIETLDNFRIMEIDKIVVVFKGNKEMIFNKPPSDYDGFNVNEWDLWAKSINRAWESEGLTKAI